MVKKCEVAEVWVKKMAEVWVMNMAGKLVTMAEEWMMKMVEW